MPEHKCLRAGYAASVTTNFTCACGWKTDDLVPARAAQAFSEHVVSSVLAPIRAWCDTVIYGKPTPDDLEARGVQKAARALRALLPPAHTEVKR